MKTIVFFLTSCLGKIYFSDDLHWDGTRIDGKADFSGRLPEESYPDEVIKDIMVDPS